jgi:DNA-binding MarR family transcriptional regulator
MPDQRRPIPPLLNDSLGFNLDRVHKLLRRKFLDDLRDYDLTPEQWQVMAVLWESSDPLRQQDVVELTLKDKHNVSRIIKRLEAKGWVVRESDPEDGRAFVIRITRKGKRREKSIKARLIPQPPFDGLSTTEGRQLLELLKEIRHRLGDL